MVEGIPKRWKVLSGQNKWKGLLDPLDPDLRRYIIHYGEMSQVGYDAFNWDRKSRYAGDCYYSKNRLLARTGFLKANPFRYKVTKYIYATASIKLPISFIVKSLSKDASRVQTNWMGYIAVATDQGKAMLGRRDIVVAWRGTLQPYEWANDFDFPLEPAISVFPVTDPKDNPRIGSGWLDIYTASDSRSPYDTTSAQEQVQGELKRLLELYKDEEISITFTGHSLGAVMSVLSAADLVYGKKNNININLQKKQVPITVFAFGSPRIGDHNFKNVVDSLQPLNILRIVNVPDVAPHYPLLLYSEIGEVLEINTLNSTYLKRSLNFRNYHNLEIYLHGMAGMQDTDGVFKLEIGRDISLVNKGLDALKDEYLVPSTWRCLANKGMLQMDDGTWKLDVHRRDHDDDVDADDNDDSSTSNQLQELNTD
ncbi:Contains similarity to petal abundant lipase-like protein Pn47p mRNA from Ipomoea nil gb/U55867 and contains a lipase PF/01764 domain [Arabidopsis thaliana]|uniref:Phospholipase A1-IIalpha n=2 Tax=Arabidopsis thaliana TaxID=3702 RepID=PLA18_ARATH|nr:alpha/beta-Hydrolases superfamily protein [Arabidopsis thaliana]Q9LNC2.1 RecName: Full=Phospholipase A1-IIalpha [Arabidopsis thaliana]AAF80222.1 Contains similarity to petal abundant lipase-like protein Pn47p mRNA from Ipomoea nil gb/U55867 and contains a lipase PF/01764 domain [Arabidopsis thaliana]AEE27968.1 alpha/beta-Hydrolases superfamily protein [Arabidopsis thaliana]|eukprot:NP_172115.1 alpha/beta-Hydrolases superfamily protein [Arabidopsis thaliana]